MQVSHHPASAPGCECKSYENYHSLPSEHVFSRPVLYVMHGSLADVHEGLCDMQCATCFILMHSCPFH